MPGLIHHVNDVRWTRGEQFEYWPSPLCPPPIHLHDERDQSFPVFRRSSAFVYYTERKAKRKKQGRPWKEARVVGM